MRLVPIQQLEDLGVVNYIGLHVWTLALGGIYHGDKFDVFAWLVILWICLRFRNVKINEISQKDGYLHSKMHCLTLDLHCTAILGTIFFRFISSLKLVYFSDFLGFKYAYLCL